MPAWEEIVAAGLVRTEGEDGELEDAEERTLDLGRCPVGGRLIVDNGVGVELPPPGEGIHAEILTTTGAQELKVERLEDGTVKLEDVGAEGSSAADPTSYAPGDADLARNAPPACKDDLYLLKGEKVYSSLDYYFNRTTTPSNLTPDGAKEAIVKAGQSIVNQHNDCGFSDKVSAGARYLGDTITEADSYVENGAIYCGPFDGSSVVSFGNLVPGVLAVECTNTVANPAVGYASIVESDIEVNRAHHGWTTAVDSSCNNQFDLQGVLTHERGHSFGLGHAETEYEHGRLTMSPIINPCSIAERSLGLGDVRGLRFLY